ncbi:MAG: clostripain-related cysteine peptidase [bacterium]
MFSKKYRMFLGKAIFVSIMSMLIVVASGCAPVIKNFTPERGIEGTEVTIEGKRFGDTADENTVKFGDATATDISVPDKNKIVAKVPTGAETGLISVTVSGRTGKSRNSFIVVGPSTSKWTFMVYLDGDNNLESAGIDDFLEMAAVGSSDEVNIVVQMDRAPGHDDTYGDWTGTKRFLIQNGDTPSVAAVQNLGEENMGDPAVLQDFVEWAVATYPADHYALSIWDHGGGWRVLREKMIEEVRAVTSRGEPDWGIARAVAWDDTDGDKLYLREVQQALEAAKPRILDRSGTLVKLDVVGFDACLMGMVEVAYALRNVANYVVGSEDLEPGDGWPYDTILGDLVATSSFSAEDVADLIVTKYGNAYGSGITQSSVDVAELSNVCNKIDALTNRMNTEWASLQAARANTFQYHPYGASYWGIDLWDFADKVYNQVTSTEIKTAALQLRNAIDDFVTNERHSPDMAGSHGVAIYFPPTQTEFNNDPDHTGYEESNTYMPVDFVKYHRWDNWLQDYYTNILLSVE